MSCAVASPAHYIRGDVEIADVIDAFGLDRWETQAAEYLFRAALKNDGAHEAQDLAKAIAKLIRALMVKSPATLETFAAFGFRLVKVNGAQAPQPKRLVPRDPGVLERVMLAEALAVYGAEAGASLLVALQARRAQVNAPEADATQSVMAALGPLPKNDPLTRCVIEMAEWAAERRARAERLDAGRGKPVPAGAASGLSQNTALAAVSLEDALETFLPEGRSAVIEGLNEALAAEGRLRASMTSSVADATRGLPRDDPSVAALRAAAETLARARHAGAEPRP